MARVETGRLSKVDAIIALGKNIGSGWTSERIRQTKDYLSPLSRVTVLAVGEILSSEEFKSGPTKKIILSSGHTAGKDTPSEAQAMKDFLLKKYPSTQKNMVILEENSIDTAGNAKEVKKIADRYGFVNIALVTIGPHMGNAETLFERHGVRINFHATSEHWAVFRSPNPKLALTNFENSRMYKKEVRKERIRSILLIFDRKGELLRKITEKTRR